MRRYSLTTSHCPLARTMAKMPEPEPCPRTSPDERLAWDAEESMLSLRFWGTVVNTVGGVPSAVADSKVKGRMGSSYLSLFAFDRSELQPVAPF